MTPTSTAEIDVETALGQRLAQGDRARDRAGRAPPKARVFGDIATPVSRIEEGAFFQGSCEMGEEDASNVVELPVRAAR